MSPSLRMTSTPATRINEHLWNHERSREDIETATVCFEWTFYVWALCAPIALASSRYILVDLNFHYPLHLLLLQLISAVVYSWTLRRRNRAATQDDTPWTSAFPKEILAGLALVLASQAVLHLPNVATLAMLSVVAHLMSIVCLSVMTPKAVPALDVIRIAWIALGCIAFLWGDYRLEVNGLIFSILTALCAGYAKSLRTIERTHSPSRAGFYFASMVMAITGMMLLGEPTTIALQDFRLRWLPIFMANMITSSAVISLGRLWLIGIFNEVDLPCNPDDQPTTRDNLTMVWLTAFSGCISSFTVHRGYTSRVQIIMFLVTILILDDGRCFGLRPSSAAKYTQIEETYHDNNEEDFTEEANRRGPEKKRRCGQTMFSLSVFIACIAFSWTNFRPSSTSSLLLHPSLDTAYQPSKRLEIVISACKEPLPSIAKLIKDLTSIPTIGTNTSIHIYTKDPFANTSALFTIGATTVTSLPNVGREGETYLHHITTHWDTLAAHTLFVQADVHNPREFYPRIKDYFDPERTGMLSLGFASGICSCDRCGDRWGWSDPGVLRTYHAKIHGESQSCSNVLLTYKGQFIASAGRIRGIPKWIYEELRGALVDPGSWAHGEEYSRGREDEMARPVLGYTVERMWGVLMQCGDLEVGWRCASLFSGRRGDGGRGDCQCFDSGMLGEEVLWEWGWKVGVLVVVGYSMAAFGILGARYSSQR